MYDREGKKIFGFIDPVSCKFCRSLNHFALMFMIKIELNYITKKDIVVLQYVGSFIYGPCFRLATIPKKRYCHKLYYLFVYDLVHRAATFLKVGAATFLKVGSGRQYSVGVFTV